MDKEQIIYDRIKSAGTHGKERRDILKFAKENEISIKELNDIIEVLKFNKIGVYRQGSHIDSPLWYFSTETGFLIGKQIIGKIPCII